MRSSVAVLIMWCGIILNACSSGSNGLVSGSESTSNFTADAVVGSPFADASGLAAVSGRMNASTFEDRQVEVEALLAATSADKCNFEIDLQNVAQYTNCYGPSVTLEGTHPNTNMVETTTLPGGDLGIWSETNASSVEACTASQINQLVEAHTSRAHTAYLAAASLACYMSNSAIAVPALGSTKSLASDELADFSFGGTGQDKMTATSASVEAFEHSSGQTGYRYVLEAELKDHETNKEVSAKIVVQYVALDSARTTYKTTVSYNLQNPDETDLGNCPSGGLTYAGYEVVSKAEADGNLSVSLDHASFCGASEVLESDYSIDAANTYDSVDRPHGWGNSWNSIMMNYNPDSSSSDYLVGKYVFAWQAGPGDTHTRVFNAEVLTGGASATGVGYFGYGPKVKDGTSRSADIGKIQGMICNWTGPGSNLMTHDDQIAANSKVQKQSMSKNEDGVWVPGTSNILYAPTNECSFNHGAFGAFGYSSSEAAHTNNLAGADAAESADGEDLFSISLDGDGFFSDFTSPEVDTF